MRTRLVFTEVDDLVSWTIRWLSRSRASHIGVELASGEIVSAEEGGVRRWSLDSFLGGGRKVVAVYEARPEVEPRLDIAYLLEQVGDRYDFEGAFGLGVVMLVRRWFSRRWRNPLAQPHEYICSSLVLTLNRLHGIPEFDGFDPALTTPQTLLRALEAQRSFVKVKA